MPFGVLRQVLEGPNQVLAVLSFSKLGHLKEGLEGVWRVSGGCLEGVWMSMEVVLMMSQHNNGVWSVYRVYKEPNSFSATL